MADAPEDIILFPSKGKAAAMLAVAVALAAVGVLIIVNREDLPSQKWVVVSCILLPVGLFLAVYAVRKLGSKTPLVVVNREGITDHASPIGAGLVRWEEIRDLQVTEKNGVRFLCIIPVSLDAIAARLPEAKAKMLKFESGEVGPPGSITLPQTFMPITVDELHERILQYRRALAGGA